MTQVWKYTLYGPGQPSIKMPEGAKLLHVEEQEGVGALWALVDPEAAVVPRRITIVGTGWDMNGEEGKYVGTWQAARMVWHVFDGGES